MLSELGIRGFDLSINFVGKFEQGLWLVLKDNGSIFDRITYRETIRLILTNQIFVSKLTC